MTQPRTVLPFLLGLALLSSAGAANPAQAGPAAIQTQETNTAGIAADLIECRRKEGVLSVKVRYRNASSPAKTFRIIDGRNYAKFYVTAASKKYFMLKDSEGTPLTVEADNAGWLNIPLVQGQQFVWWARYPAPPAGVKKITFYTPLTPPFEDIPITDQ